MLIEETFPLSCSMTEFEEFIDKSDKDRGRLDRLLLGRDAGGIEEVQDARGRHDAQLAGILSEESQDNARRISLLRLPHNQLRQEIRAFLIPVACIPPIPTYSLAAWS